MRVERRRDLLIADLLNIIERYNRTDVDTFRVETVVEDPNVFAKPITQITGFKRHTEWHLMDCVCEANNKEYDDLFKNKGK